METKFQTSFIPKKPLPSAAGGVATLGVLPPRKHHSMSLFLDIAILLFIVSFAAAGGTYLWKSILISSQESYKQQLAERQRQFNPELIEELQRVNVKIDAAGQVLSRHIVLSNVFDIISRLTIENVRFVNLDLSIPTVTQGSGIKVALSGYGTNLSTVAFQSDVLGQLQQYGLSKIVKDPVLSDPSLEANGLVSFRFSALIDPATLSYQKSVSGTTAPPATQQQ